MAKSKISQSGVAILEAGIVLILLLSILMAGWGSVDIFQRGLMLEELVEGTFYDGVVSAYRIDPEDIIGTVRINREGLSSYLNQRVVEVGTELLDKTGSTSDFFVQGALVEVLWKEGQSPQVERVTLSRTAGQLSMPFGLRNQIDLESLVQGFSARMAGEDEKRERFIRSPLWQYTGVAQDAEFERIILTGISAAINVRPGPARLLLEGIGQHPLIARSSFNVVRKDL